MLSDLDSPRSLLSPQALYTAVPMRHHHAKNVFFFRPCTKKPAPAEGTSTGPSIFRINTNGVVSNARPMGRALGRHSRSCNLTRSHSGQREAHWGLGSPFLGAHSLQVAW